MAIIRKTKPVKTLLKIFEQTNTAISAVELVERLSGEMNKTTVYRILERFENEGMLHFFRGQDGLKYYIKSQGHSSLHPHFQCRDCGKTECLHIDISIPSIANYKIDSVELLLIGQCKDCLS